VLQNRVQRLSRVEGILGWLSDCQLLNEGGGAQNMEIISSGLYNVT
jgi:hypothetical protein